MQRSWGTLIREIQNLKRLKEHSVGVCAVCMRVVIFAVTGCIVYWLC